MRMGSSAMKWGYSLWISTHKYELAFKLKFWCNHFTIWGFGKLLINSFEVPT